MSKEEFYSFLSSDFGIKLSSEKKSILESFIFELVEYNRHTNITAICNEDEIYLKHLYDSLTLVKAVDLSQNLEVLDVGSGGGFPGIVLKIVFPNLKITLIDSNHKKTDFQNYIINKLNLKGIVSVNKRAEIYFKEGKRYDLVVARAVSQLNKLSEITIPFVKKSGYFVAMKGSSSQEVNDAMYAINFLGGKIEEVIGFNLPITGDCRTLVKIKKIKDTPSEYPRAYDKIVKKPLINK
jgi:16S rRNA (guanine527-N7)-methyltransferase